MYCKCSFITKRKQKITFLIFVWNFVVRAKLDAQKQALAAQKEAVAAQEKALKEQQAIVAELATLLEQQQALVAEVNRLLEQQKQLVAEVQAAVWFLAIVCVFVNEIENVEFLFFFCVVVWFE